MAIVVVTTSPATLDSGVSEFVTVTNTGAVDVTVARGAQSYTLRPTQGRVVYPEGAAVTASVVSGSGQVSTVAQAAQVTQAQQLTANTAAIAGLPNTYAQLSGPVAVARRLVSRGMPRPVALYSGTAPTVTVSAASAATSITNGILRAPKRRTYIAGDGAALDVTDPSFSYLGTPQGMASYGTGAPDFNAVRWTLLTGGSGQAARWVPVIGFEHYGQVIEVSFKAFLTTKNYRIWIDGQPVTEDLQAVSALSVGSIHLLKVDFGSVAARRIHLEMDDLEFGGVYIEPTATVQRLNTPGLSMAVIGDSLTGGAGDVNRLDVPLVKAAQILGVEQVYNLAIGGTGWLNGGATNAYYTRYTTDLAACGPVDVIVLWGGQNDSGFFTAAAIQAQVTADLTQVKALHPESLILVIGQWTPQTLTDTNAQNCNAAIKAACAATSVPFIDMFDPAGSAATATAFSAATSYRIGDIVLNSNGVLYECIAFHSAAAFNASHFRPISVVYGTGKKGNLQGDGNADLFTYTDGIHLQLAGAKFLGRWFADRIYAAARALL